MYNNPFINKFIKIQIMKFITVITGDNRGFSSIFTLLAIFMIIGTLYTIGSVMHTELYQSDNFFQFPENETKKVLDDITSYLMIEEGYACTHENGMKIILLVKPVFDTDISLEDISLQIVQKGHLTILGAGDVHETRGSLFDANFWKDIGYGTFVVIPVLDGDNSLSSQKLVNGDIFFVAFKIDDMEMGDTASFSFLTPYGRCMNIEVQIPFSTSGVFRIF